MNFGVSVCRSKSEDGVSIWTPEKLPDGTILKFASPREAIRHGKMIWKMLKRAVSVIQYSGDDDPTVLYWSMSATGVSCNEAKLTIEFAAPILCDCYENKHIYCPHRMLSDINRKRKVAA